MEREICRGRIGSNREFSVFKEAREKKTSIGVAVLIIGLDPNRNGENESNPLIWTISELKTKFETDKSAGQISIPAETRKSGESVENNVFGALAEFCDDNAFSSYIKDHVIKTDNWYKEKGIFIRERPADVAVLIYDGALDFPLKPACFNEVSPNGWVKKSELKVDPRLRDAFRQVLDLDDKEGIIKSALESYCPDPKIKRSIFPDSFNSIQRFNNEREFGIDTEVLPWGYREVCERFPEAYSRIMETIKLLTESQKSGEKRNFKKEEENVSKLEDFINTLRLGTLEIGIGKIDGSGIKDVACPRGGFKSWGKDRKKLCGKNRDPEEYRLRLVEDTSIKGWGDWELQTGDSLGYPTDLGKDWYLLLGRNMGNGREDYYAIVPIDRINSLQLRPYDTGF